MNALAGEGQDLLLAALSESGLAFDDDFPSVETNDFSLGSEGPLDSAGPMPSVSIIFSTDMHAQLIISTLSYACHLCQTQSPLPICFCHARIEMCVFQNILRFAFAFFSQ